MVVIGERDQEVSVPKRLHINRRDPRWYTNTHNLSAIIDGLVGEYKWLRANAHRIDAVRDGVSVVDPPNVTPRSRDGALRRKHARLFRSYRDCEYYSVCSSELAPKFSSTER